MSRFLVAMVLALALAPAGAGADEWSRSFTVKGRPSVRVRTDDGLVRITTTTTREVVVHAHTRGWIFGQDVDMEASQVGDVVEIVARTPRFEWGFLLRPRSLWLDIEMPGEADLDVSTGDGSVEIDPLAGAVEVRTGDGPIRAHGIRGNLRITTGDGGIEADGLDGTLHASSADGPILVRGRFDGVELLTGDGRVMLEAARGSSMGSGWSVRTGDGSVTLRLGERLGADLDAQTSDGRIFVDFPVETSGGWGRRHIRGSMNGGGPPLRVRTGDGSIRIEKL